MDVLVVGQDDGLRVVQSLLAARGWTARHAGHVEAALRECDARLPDVMVMALAAGEPGALPACASLRARNRAKPGVVIVANDEVDVLRGFEAGADDCVVRPIRPGELAARVGALGRRLGGDPPVLARGTLRIESDARRAWVGERRLSLTPTELAVLELLVRHPGRAFHRMELLRDVWNTQVPGYARNVDCHVTRLRRKLEAAGLDPAPIETVPGTGYLFSAAA
jgi:DNA-binding response OmpR family regulator